MFDGQDRNQTYQEVVLYLCEYVNNIPWLTENRCINPIIISRFMWTLVHGYVEMWSILCDMH